MTSSNTSLSFMALFCITIGLLDNPITASEAPSVNKEAPTPPAALARCYLRYAKDNSPQHECTAYIKELNHMILKCTMKDSNKEENAALPLCNKLMQHLYLLSGGSFPSTLDTGLDQGPFVYIHPRSGQSIDLILHLDPSAPDYPHKWGGHSCTLDSAHLPEQPTKQEYSESSGYTWDPKKHIFDISMLYEYKPNLADTESQNAHPEKK